MDTVECSTLALVISLICFAVVCAAAIMSRMVRACSLTARDACSDCTRMPSAAVATSSRGLRLLLHGRGHGCRPSAGGLPALRAICSPAVRLLRQRSRRRHRTAPNEPGGLRDLCCRLRLLGRGLAHLGRLPFRALRRLQNVPHRATLLGHRLLDLMRGLANLSIGLHHRGDGFRLLTRRRRDQSRLLGGGSRPPTPRSAPPRAARRWRARSARRPWSHR